MQHQAQHRQVNRSGRPGHNLPGNAGAFLKQLLGQAGQRPQPQQQPTHG